MSKYPASTLARAVVTCTDVVCLTWIHAGDTAIEAASQAR